MADHTIQGVFNGADEGTTLIKPYIEVDWTQNRSQNTSTVTATLIFERYTNNYKSRNEYPAGHPDRHDCTFNVGGSTLTQTRPFNMRRENPPNSVAVWTRTETIKHNTNGTGSVYISASGDTKVNIGNYSFGETVTLPTIARQTTITSVSMRNNLRPTAFNALDITISRKHSSYTHEFEILAGSTSLHSSTGNVPTSIRIEAEDVRKMIDRMETVTKRDFTFRVSTYNGNTLIGRATKNFEVILHRDSTKPTIDSTWLSRLGSGHDATIGKFVQNISRVRLQFEADYGQGATRQSQTIKINGTPYEGRMLADGVTYRVDTEPLNLTGTVTFEYIATNSRGQESEPYTREYTFHAYKPPSITRFTAVRSETNPTNVIVSRRHTRTSLDGDNIPTGKIERQEFGSSTWQEVNSSNSLSLDTTLTGNSETTSYIFRATITDRFGNSATAEVSVGTAKVLMEKYKDEGVSFGKRFETGKGTLQVGGDIYHVSDGGIPSNITTPILIRPDLENGFGNYSWGFVGYTKVGGIVHLNGMITVPSTAASGQRIFLLPVGYRPNMTKVYVGHSSSNSYRIDITAAGTVRWNNNSSGINWV